MDTVGFIGLGKMGSGMAGNIQKAGYPMVVYDVREEAAKPLLEGGARLANSPAQVASLSDVMFTSVPMPRDIEQVVTGNEGVLEGVKEGSVHFDLSTVGPNLVRRLEPMYREKGAHFLDAPVMSSPTNVLTRNVMVLVGGDKEIYERHKPVLDSFADFVMHCGGIGTGQICKVINNTTGFGVGQAIIEGLTMGLKAGVELDVLLEAGSRGPLGGRSAGLAQMLFKGNFEPPTFTLALSRKDVGLATEVGRDVGVPMPVASAVEQIMIQAMNRPGWSEQDYSIYLLIQEEMAAQEVRSEE